MPSEMFLALVIFATPPPVSNDGMIGGMVVNGTDEARPVARAKVVLQVRSNGGWTVMDETTSDAAGRFLFRGLLVSEHVEYKLGANHQDIYYPGPQMRLTPASRQVHLNLAVRDVVHAPNPLVVRDHEICVEAKIGMLRVTESMIVENPTSRTYVGPQAEDPDTLPTTLQLSIPSDFQKVTFYKEFFGRAFAVRDGKLETSVPWEPGRRELKFTYVLRNATQHRIWERPVDLPTDRLRLQVKTDAPQEASCRFGSETPLTKVGRTDVLYESRQRLSAGETIHVELDRLRIPWMVYGRWGAVAILAIVVGGSLLRRLLRQRPVPAGAAQPVEQPPALNQGTQRKGPSRRRRSRRAA